MGKERYAISIKSNVKASIGIGAMIVFIAMVLVAGIAASVIIQTATRLEMQALKTGSGTISEVASGLNVEAIEGNSSTSVLNKMAIEIKPRAGSPDIDLSETVVEISDASTKHLLRYSNNGATGSTSVNGALFNISNFGSSTTFDIIVLQDADNSVSSDTVINFGDHVVIAIDAASIFTTNNGLLPRTDVSGFVISEEGVPGIIGFTTPCSYTSAKQIVELQ